MFIEVTDDQYGAKVLLNTNQICQILEGGNNAIIWLSNGNELWTRERYEVVKEMLKHIEVY